jgi:predicted dehydrogenase
MASRKRYALVGTGARSEMYIDALSETYRDVAELVAICDLSHVRMNWYNQHIQDRFGLPPVPAFSADEFDRMIATTKPDSVIVCTMDSEHHTYICRAMELGCDVITEKPMTIDIEKLNAIYDTIARTGKSVRVTHNYRYAPAFSRFRELIVQGVIGKPLLVDFAWMLDTSHGADYFRRWHREKRFSGGLLLSKACHHFDLVNWWIDSDPDTVFAMGNLLFYGSKNAADRGEHYTYDRYTGIDAAKNDPFALSLEDRESFRGLYLSAEGETGYRRDMNVFGGPITIEDTMAITARYTSGAVLSYCLVAYSPWEGLRITITGNKGRIELEVVEKQTHLLPDSAAPDAKVGAAEGQKISMKAFPMFGVPYDVEIPPNDGNHGGADPVMLDDIFLPEPPPDPLHRAASHIDGTSTILLGIAANESIRSGLPVRIDDLFTKDWHKKRHAVGHHHQ